jgi:hypothetical protein
MTNSNNRAKTSTLKLHLKVFIIQKNFDNSKNELGDNWWIFTENFPRIAGRTGSQGNWSPQVKKSRNTTISPGSGVGTCSSRGARPSPVGKKPTASYSRIRSVVTLDSPKTKDGGRDFERFEATRSYRLASTSSISSASDLTSPSSRLPDPLAAQMGRLPEVEWPQPLVFHLQQAEVQQ